jgi:hypothetical protein
MGVAATWLPPELTTVQPYSMGPLTRWGERVMMLPAHGTIVRMDDRATSGPFSPANEMMIRGAFVAPASVQRAAQKEGEKALIMAYPAGLLEALGLAENGQASDLVNVGGGHGGLEVTPRAAEAIEEHKTFIDALRALEDEE